MVVFHYPLNAGGKFISLCLAISPQFLHQHENLAVKKINGMSEDQAFNFSINCMSIKKKTNQHYELGCRYLTGFNLPDGTTDANQLFIDLSNGNQYWFAMMYHEPRPNPYFPKSRNIVLKNYEWIMKDRNTQPVDFQFNGDGTEHYFDMESIKHKDEFMKEIDSLCGYIGMDVMPSTENMDRMRNEFLETYKIGF